MSLRFNQILVPLVLLGAVVTGAGAAMSPPVLVRQTGFKALGAAFKQVNEMARASTNDPVRLQKAVGQIQAASRQQYGWFPKGSGPAPGVKTSAKAEIWTEAARFRAAQDAFLNQSGVLAATAHGGDLAKVGAEARKLGATCKGCHDQFRQSDD